MSFSYDKWKKQDNHRIQSNQNQQPSIKSYESWNNERKSNAKVQQISKGLSGISMEEYRKQNPAPVETQKEETVTKEKKVTTKKEEKSSNLLKRALSGISNTAQDVKDSVTGFGQNIIKSDKGAIVKTAFDMALEALGYTSPTSAGVLKGAVKSENENDQLSEKVGSNLRAGTGDFIKQAGDGLNYLGANKIGQGIAKAGESFSDGFGEAYKGGKEFTWGNLLDPEYYATNVSRQVPQMATMLIGGGVGAGLKGLTSLTKLPTIAKTVVGVTGGAGAMTAIESAMEAGGVYEEAKRRGMSEADAKSAADETFKKNLALTGGTSLIELGLGMSPLTRGVSRMGVGKQIAARTAGGVVTEGTQEGLQEKISTEALGDEFKWTDPSTVEAMVIGGLLGGATTGGMSSLQLANSPQNNSFTTITKNTIDSLSGERRAEFDELVDTGRQQGKSFDEAQFDALEDLASRYDDVVENTRQSARNFIDNEKLQRAKAASPMEQNQKEQTERNTMNFDLANLRSDYQFNRAAIAENPNVTSTQLPPQAKMLQQLLQQPSLPAQTQQQSAELAANLSPLPYSPNDQMSPAAIQAIPTVSPTNMAQLNVPSITPPIDNETEPLKAPSPVENTFGDLQVGDEIKLKGTKAETTYTVIEDDGGKMVKVETSAGKTINVPRNSINDIVMRVADANVMADPIEDTSTVVEPLDNNGVEIPLQTESENEIKSPPSFTDKIVSDINELIAQGQNVETAIAEVRNNEIYQSNLEEFDKVVAENYSRSAEQRVEEEATQNTDQLDQNTDQQKQQADDSASLDKNSKKQELGNEKNTSESNKSKFTGATLARVIKEGSSLNAEIRPQGLYMSLVQDRNNFESPFEDVGNITVYATFNPINPLIAVERRAQHARFKNSERDLSSGVSGLFDLVGVERFNELLQMNKKELTDLLNKEFPNYDYERYFDSYELLEAYAGQLARKQGYDSIILEDSLMPEFSEVAVLKNDVLAFENNSEVDETSSPVEDATGEIGEKQELDEENREGNENVEKTSDTLPSDTINKPAKEITNGSGIDGKAFTEAGTEIQFRYKVVDASQLVASHDTSLRANEAYPSELQPRDRSRQASQQQITNIAQKLNPELVGESAKASDGAPIVSPDFIVESGNGRTIAMQKMYKENYPTAAAYKNHLVENATKYGLDSAQLKEMENPILVRVRTNKVNRQAFVEEANVSNVASMSSVEQAVSDSKKLTNKVMYLFSPSENGDLNTASNRAFIAQFVQSVVPQNERGILMTGDGALSQDGLRRVQNAILAKAYGNSEALMLMIESNDNNVKTLTNALLQAAPAIVKMKDGIQNKAYYSEDISNDLVMAVEKYSDLRNEGVSVDTFLNQTSLFDDGISNISKELLVLFDKGVYIDGKARKSAKAYKGLIDTYVEVLQAAGNPNQQSFFEDMAPTKEELFTSAIEKVRNDNDSVQANLFEDESQSSEKAGRASRREASATTDTFVGAKGNRRKSKEEVKQGETTRAEIIRFVTDTFKVRVDIGQYRQRAKGVYKNQFAIIRTKDYADFEVIAHEIGHRFDMKFGWSTDPAIKQEWIKFAEDNLELPKSMTPLQKSREGVAEYFRQYLYNETEAPKNYTELSETLQNTVNASMKKVKWDKSIVALRGKMLDWMNRDAEQELRGVVAPIGQQKIRLTAKQFITKYYTKLFEKEHPIFDAIKQIEKETGLKIEGRSNAYQMSVLTRGTVARAATFIKRETFNTVTGERTGESLESILKDVDDVESFGRYLVARHGLYLMEKQGKSKTPLSPELMKEYLENGKHYEQHAERIYKYQDQLLKVLVDGNLISEDLPKTLRDKYPYYVPFYRVMTETGEKTSNLGGGGSSQQYVNQQQGVKRMSAQGSSRNIVNPIESIIRNTHLYFGLADRNAVGFAMSELADPEGEFVAEVTRDIIEEIPSKMKLYEAQINDIMGTLTDAGLSEDALDDMDLEATFKLFEPVFRPNSSNNEILVWKEGKPKLYKVHDTLLYNSLIAFDNRAISEAFGVLFKPMEASNNLLRSGITASPYFTIRTFWRSLAQIFVKTEATGFNYVTHPLRVMKAIGSVAESRFRNNDAVTEWWKSGGAQSTFIAVENKYLDKELSKIKLNKRARNYIRSTKQGTKAERRALNWYLTKTTLASPINLFQLFNDTLDQGLKLAEYQVVKKQTGSRQAAALASREADIDYKRFGSSTREFNKLALFFNVALQGPDNLARTFNKHPVRTSLRALTLITLPTLFLYAINRDDEEYQELDSWEKDMNWMVPMGNGTFIKVPIPFELGVLFKTIPEKLFGEYLDATRQENKQNFDNFYKNALSTMVPSYIPTLANVWYGYLFERSASFNREYVPKSLQGLEKPEQFDEKTSEIMKYIGKKVNKSPIVLQETFKAQFGQMGQFYLWGVDQALLWTGVIERPDTRGLKRGYTERYVTSSVNDGGTNSITKFYEELDKKERHYKTHGTKYDPPEDLKLYRQVSDDMSTLRKLRNDMMYDKMLDENDKPFSKEIKKDHVETINIALRDMARYIRIAAKDDEITEERMNEAYEKGVMDKENFNRAINMLGNYESYQKSIDKEARKEAARLKDERALQKQNNK